MNEREHGTSSAYRHGCRCDTCRNYWNHKHTAARWARAARRVLDADGRLAAPVPPHKHGRTSTYNGWMCRCRDCTDAHAQSQRLRKTRDIPAAYEFCYVHGEVTEDHECEAT